MVADRYQEALASDTEHTNSNVNYFDLALPGSQPVGHYYFHLAVSKAETFGDLPESNAHTSSSGCHSVWMPCPTTKWL